MLILLDSLLQEMMKCLLILSVLGLPGINLAYYETTTKEVTTKENKVDGIRWTDIKARFDSSKCKEICRISANSRPKSCSELTNFGSGVYDIYVDGSRVKVYCDMSKDGGGWTVIQRRGHFGTTENFYRGWNDYRNGFGDPYKVNGKDKKTESL